MGAEVTGVDLVPENILYAKMLADDFNILNISFIESDIMKLSNIHDETYDIVFTSEGAIGWLTDLNIWAQTIRTLLKKDDFFYVMDGHLFYLVFDEKEFGKNQLEVKYPYFLKYQDKDNTIGGYAS